MNIPNWLRAALENLVSAVGAAFGVLSVMKVFEAVGLMWAPKVRPLVGLGDLAGEPLQKAAKLVGSTVPESIAAAFSSYILMGLFFAWMTNRFAQKYVTNPSLGYAKRAAQEAAIMVIIWPMRLASDLSKSTYWELTPWYVGLMLAVAEVLIAISLLTGLAQFG